MKRIKVIGIFLAKISVIRKILGIIILATGFFLAVGSWAHNWLGIVGSPNFGPIDLALCIFGIIMAVTGVLINRKLILS